MIDHRVLISCTIDNSWDCILNYHPSIHPSLRLALHLENHFRSSIVPSSVLPAIYQHIDKKCYKAPMLDTTSFYSSLSSSICPFILPDVDPLASSIRILRLSWCALPLNHSLLYHPPIHETHHTAVLLGSAALHLSYHSHQFMFPCWSTFIYPLKTLFYLPTSIFLFTVSSGESVRILQKLSFVSSALYYPRIKIKGRFMSQYRMSFLYLKYLRSITPHC